jgi:hypothetical protein
MFCFKNTAIKADVSDSESESASDYSLELIDDQDDEFQFSDGIEFV